MAGISSLELGGFKLGFNWRMLGTPAPVFPGFEVDILERVSDEDKPDALWHRNRAKAILRAHPEVKELVGRHPLSALFCVAAAAAQVGLAVASAHMPWWGLLLSAYMLGGPLNIVLFQLAHECNHGLVFKRPVWNRRLFTITTLPMFLSAHHTWWVEHLVHHNDMGAKKDFISRRRSFFLLTRFTSPLFVPWCLFMLVTQVLRSAVGLILYAFTSLLRGKLDPTAFVLSVLTDEHLVSGYKRGRMERWAVAYPALSFALYGALFWYGGWAPMAYLLAAQAFFTGFLHPYCLGWVLGISHFHGRKNYQPSASHYGRLINLLSFNAGLHVEHHDLAGIPWPHLWRLRRIAPEFYNDLETIRSYTLLGLQFVFASRNRLDQHFSMEAHRNRQRFNAVA